MVTSHVVFVDRVAVLSGFSHFDEGTLADKTNSTVFDSHMQFGDALFGYCRGSEAGRALYHDDDHLGEYGNRQSISIFKLVFEENNLNAFSSRLLI